jgi:hypothetical protein
MADHYHTRAQREKLERQRKSAGKVLSAVGSGLKSAVSGQVSPRAQAERKRRSERAKIDAAITGVRKGGRKRPVKPVQPQTPIGGAAGQAIRGATGLDQLTDILGNRRRKKK